MEVRATHSNGAAGNASAASSGISAVGLSVATGQGSEKRGSRKRSASELTGQVPAVGDAAGSAAATVPAAAVPTSAEPSPVAASDGASGAAMSKGEEEYRQRRKQRRLLKNREAAQLSRQRHKAYVDSLEKKAQMYDDMQASGKAYYQSKVAENKLLKEHLTYLQAVVQRLQATLSNENKALKDQLSQVLGNLNSTDVPGSTDAAKVISDLPPMPAPLPAGTLSALSDAASSVTSGSSSTGK